MQPTLQPAPPAPHVDPQSDPHEAIAALLRGNSSQPRWSDPSELNITADDSTSAPPLAPAAERVMPPPPLDDTIDIVPERAPQPSAGRGLTRFVLTVCAGIAATIGWQAYGDEARQMVTALAPQLLAQAPTQNAATEPQTTAQATAAQPAESAPAAQPAPDTAATPAQPAPAAAAAQPAPPAAAPVAESAQAAVPAEVTQQLDSMSREIAALKQTIEQLKAEQQISREAAAKAQDAKRKISTQTPKPPQPQRAAAAHAAQPVSPAPRGTQPYPQQPYPQQTYPQQTYGQSQPYPSQQPYGQAQAYPPRQTLGQTYPQGSVPRDDITIPPPRTLPPEPGFGPTAPRPPMPLQ